MAKRIAVSTLNASTIDILNTIRANASYEYQSLVPAVTTENDIPKVGEILYGYPALANQFVNALINRIASVRVKSATFNNAYAELKKGYLEFGETVEEVFVGIAKAREFSVEKAEAREFKRTLPDVRSAFHTMNYRVQYPITIQEEDLRMAFLSAGGVQDLIAKIVDAVYTANEYDEYLLFKYLMIKAIAHGKMYPVAVDMTDIKNAAISFRGMSNQLGFMGKKYNASGVTTTTPKSDQYIFMDSTFNATFDVEVLASAFNMDKTDFMGKLKLIDDWTTFDNERFDVIRAGSDQIEEVTDEELELMADVKAVLVDSEWFQVYDNLQKFTEKYVASGMYWNYFLNVWKTVSSSPFSNAIVFVDSSADTDLPDTITAEVTGKSVSENATVITLEVQEDDAVLVGTTPRFIQTEDAVEEGIAIHKYGAVIFPANADSINIEFEVNGTVYTSTTKLADTADVGDTLSFQSGESPEPSVSPTLSAITVTGGTLSPVFAPETLTYSVNIESSTDEISFTLTDGTNVGEKEVTVVGTVTPIVPVGGVYTIEEVEDGTKISILVTNVEGDKSKTYVLTVAVAE